MIPNMAILLAISLRLLIADFQGSAAQARPAGAVQGDGASGTLSANANSARLQVRTTCR